jgi:hypothetical protein
LTIDGQCGLHGLYREIGAWAEIGVCQARRTSFGLFPIRSVLRNISESRMTTEGITATTARIGPQRLLVIIMRYPKARTIQLLPDNLNIHHRKFLTDLL